MEISKLAMFLANEHQDHANYSQVKELADQGLFVCFFQKLIHVQSCQPRVTVT